eukprot:8928942-Prorocentrum_lima.AAC.1
MKQLSSVGISWLPPTTTEIAGYTQVHILLYVSDHGADQASLREVFMHQSLLWPNCLVIRIDCLIHQLELGTKDNLKLFDVVVLFKNVAQR